MIFLAHQAPHADKRNLPSASGGITTFAPRELLASSSVAVTPLGIILVQAAGALYLGFAILNWTAKDNLLGGIYSRPVALGNLLHFGIMAIALLKAVATGERASTVLLACGVYVLFAAWFSVVTFGSPIGKKAV